MNRKRSREEDLNDFMPLSKRINNLHIDNNSIPYLDNTHGIIGPILTSNNVHELQQKQQFLNMQQQHLNGTQLQHNQIASQQCLSDENSLSESEYSNGTGVSSVDSGVETMILNEYCPDLSAEQNPFYYAKNKLLYDLYVERMRRYQMNPF